ncbi:MAG: tetratricopeptide repeat protein, partial [Emcibacter sp.]|nr:tetratricopeptide repeat protein [Emcibacter sp.]
GRLLGLQKKYAKSLESFLLASDLGAEGSQFTVDLARANINMEQADKAVAIMQSWLLKKKDDLAVRHILAGYYLQEKAYDKSINQYEIILGMSAENPIALNNIAWLYSQTGQNKKALMTAEKSYNLFPDAAPFIDTYAWILVEQGQNEKGLALLQKAVAKAPKMVEIRYHLAVALNNAGKRTTARKELETVISSGEVFSDVDKARKLMRELSK